MFFDLLFERLQEFLGSETAARFAAMAAGVLAIVVIAWIADRVLRRYALRAIERLARRSAVVWDDILLEHGVLARASFVLPSAMVWRLAPEVLPAAALPWVSMVRSVALVGVIVATALALDAAVTAVREIYRRRQGDNRIPTGGVVQLLKSAIYLVAGLLVVSVLVGQTPWFVLSGLGALTAVLLIVFRDPLLGLVGGFHLTINDMVRVGDWIEMPTYGADGTVLDISLTSVKVQNWDKTISTVPTYSLVSDSFRNWRGMDESGGRRIKRSINVDMTSVRFVDDELYERLSRIELLREYLARKQDELDAYNRKHGTDESSLVNGRRITNLGTFRAYLIAYLRRHPDVHDDMTFLVRQLEPTPQGIPMEIYVFSRNQVWADYESIQADIFDHVLASIPAFGLRVYQRPAGADFAALGAGRAAV